jgi:ABC-type transport system involved in cytochrome bd biosynthesis fused ATPase/permease subunit
MSAPAPGTGARSWRLAALFALAALLCGLLLGGVSAWFLGSVALAGLTATAFAFNFHIPGALVRLFAIGRTAARYGERLVGHKAALADQVTRRVHLFSSMAAAPGVRRAGWQLGDQARLADYLDDVEDVDFARLRFGLPGLTLAVGLAACLVATAFVAPLALLAILPAAAIAVPVGLVAARRGAAAWALARAARRGGAEAVGSALASVVPLKAEGHWDGEIGAALALFSRADREALALRRAQTAFDALAAGFGPWAGLSVITAAWLAGARGEALLIPVFVAFAWLALGEGLNGASRLLVARLRRDAAQAELSRWTGSDGLARAADPPVAAAPPLGVLACAGLQRVAPDGRQIGLPLNVTLEAGRPTILVGASGSGKTSLLKQMAGWIGEDVFTGGEASLPPARRAALSTLCLHDAAVLDDTVRANLFCPTGPNDALWDALAAVEMTARVREAGGLDGWIGRDLLSLGEAQRLNLARAWLTDRPVVLLDEPGEHLDDEQGARLLARLLDRLSDRIVVLSSHRPVDAPGARRIELP